ncbi:MAG: hypothetical protein M1445_06625 [Bacteroidetes bacterium]|nr:hypothetical protein [Bacteroidota bacterium]
MAYTNLDYLKTVTDGNKQVIREMVEMFISQVPIFIANLNKFYHDGQYTELGKEAHKAKSSLQIMGMAELEKEMKILQLKTIDQTDIESYPIHISRFEIQCRGAIEELKAELASH